MPQAGSQAWAFYRDVARSKKLWTLCDDKGFPAPMTSSGKRAMPFWSSLARVKRIIETVPAYGTFKPYEMSWDEFCTDCVADLESSSTLVGINWSGAKATGFDVEPATLRRSVEALAGEPTLLPTDLPSTRIDPQQRLHDRLDNVLVSPVPQKVTGTFIHLLEQNNCAFNRPDSIAYIRRFAKRLLDADPTQHACRHLLALVEVVTSDKYRHCPTLPPHVKTDILNVADTLEAIFGLKLPLEHVSNALVWNLCAVPHCCRTVSTRYWLGIAQHQLPYFRRYKGHEWSGLGNGYDMTLRTLGVLDQETPTLKAVLDLLDELIAEPGPGSGWVFLTRTVFRWGEEAGYSIPNSYGQRWERRRTGRG